MFEHLDYLLKRQLAFKISKFQLNLTGKPILYYAGRGISKDLHVGHYFQLKIIRKLLKIPDSRLFYMISNDEKYLESEQDFNLNSVKVLIQQVSKILNSEHVTFFTNTEDISKLYKSALFFAKRIGHKTVTRLFGLKKNSNLVRHFYLPIQCAPCHYFNKDYNIVILLAEDQQPYFIKINKILESEGFQKVSYICVKTIPDLKIKAKMSSRVSNNSLFLTDSAQQIYKKIKSAKSGHSPDLNAFNANGDFCTVIGKALDLDLPYNQYENKKILSLEFKKIFYNSLLEQLKILK